MDIEDTLLEIDLFHEVLDQEPEERRAFIQTKHSGNAVRIERLERLGFVLRGPGARALQLLCSPNDGGDDRLNHQAKHPEHSDHA